MDQEQPLFHCFLTNASKGFFALHFNQAIPKLVGMWPGGFFSESFGPISSLPKRRVAIARRLAMLNQGRISTELVQLGKVFLSFIEELNQINGLVAVHNSDPYRLDYRVGFLFDATEIGERLAGALHTHFFLEQDLTFSISQKLKTPEPLSNPEKTVRRAVKPRSPESP